MVELSERLCFATKGKATLEAVQAISSITKFGMAALLPGKEVSVDEKINVFVDGNPTVIKKAGMQYEGTKRQGDINNQGICDSAEYAILADDCRRQKGGG